MRKHTPGPWRVAAKALVRLDHAYLIEPVDHHNFEYGAALAATSQHDARRIVACVNACEGMETEHLENQSMLGETLLDRFNLLKSEAGKLTKQRDQLLASLKELLSSKAEPGLFAGVMAADNAMKLVKSIEDGEWIGAGHSPGAGKMVPDGWRLVHTANNILKEILIELPRTVGEPNLYLIDKDVREASFLLDNILATAKKLQPQNLASNITVLRDLLSQNEWDEGTPGYLGKNQDGSGKWGFHSTGISGISHEQIDALYALAGIEPRQIIALGRCKDCMFATESGRERGYSAPCIDCRRPRMSNFSPAAPKLGGE